LGLSTLFLVFWSPSETGKDELTDRGTAFDGRMGAFHVGGIDKAEVGIHGGADQARVDKVSNSVQQPALFSHVGSSIARTGEDEFPVELDTLGLQLDDVEWSGRILDEREGALRDERLDDLVEMLFGVSHRERVVNLTSPPLF
jgi:hypothetical protein